MHAHAREGEEGGEKVLDTFLVLIHTFSKILLNALLTLLQELRVYIVEIVELRRVFFYAASLTLHCEHV